MNTALHIYLTYYKTDPFSNMLSTLLVSIAKIPTQLHTF